VTQITGLSLIVLAYNDAQALRKLLPRAVAAVSALAPFGEVIVVDDGSCDDTAEVVSHVSGGRDCVRYLRLASNQGVGAAFRSGVSAARHGTIAYIDGDGQYDPWDLSVLLPPLSHDYDVVSSVRRSRADGPHRKGISWTYRTSIRAIYGLNLRDVNSGFKVYRRTVLDAIGEVWSRGPFYDAEVLIKAIAAGARVVEVPVQHFAREFGRPRGVRLASVRSTFDDMTSLAMAPWRRPTVTARITTATVRSVRSILGGESTRRV
jgi:glycosyltransferase involved in cell wall biosynthesis